MIQNFHHESHYVRTTQASYSKKLKEVFDNPDNIKLYGIRLCTALNELEHYNITRNFLFDAGHDILEGMGKLELGLLFNQFIKIEKFFDLEFLNNRIKLFDYGQMEKRSKLYIYTNMILVLIFILLYICI